MKAKAKVEAKEKTKAKASSLASLLSFKSLTANKGPGTRKALQKQEGIMRKCWGGFLEILSKGRGARGLEKCIVNSNS